MSNINAVQMSSIFKAESTIMFLSKPHQYGLHHCKTSTCLAGEQAGDMAVCGHPNPTATWAGKVSVPDYDEPRLAQQNGSCLVKMASALRRAYLSWRSSRVIFTCCWPQKSNWILRKNYQATRQSCYWFSKGQGEMLITFVFREMLIWNAQRVTLSITISAYIDYIKCLEATSLGETGYRVTKAVLRSRSSAFSPLKRKKKSSLLLVEHCNTNKY